MGGGGILGENMYFFFSEASRTKTEMFLYTEMN